MPRRRNIPPEIRAYLGPCREPESAAEIVVEQLTLGKLTGDAGLTDYDPLVVVMGLVAEVVRELGLSPKGRKGRKVWCEAVQVLQDHDSILEHNTFLPCRWCDQAFEPVIDDKLLALFLAWHESAATEDLLALHRCPACGGQLAAKRAKKYDGDGHTPPPGSVASDEEWAELLLRDHPL
jgi:hypothetical protein